MDWFALRSSNGIAASSRTAAPSGSARAQGALELPAALRFTRDAVIAQLASFGPLSSKTIEGLALREPPDTRLIRSISAVAVDAYPDALLRHCLRCWHWAGLLARMNGEAYDEESLYVSCLLHDLALTDAHRPLECGCFAVQGAIYAQTILMSSGASDRTVEVVAEAIAAHMDMRLPRAATPEARLLHDAAHLDVVGARSRTLPQPILREVIARYPREDFGAHFTKLMRREASERPRSRAALMWRLGMSVAIARNRLDRLS